MALNPKYVVASSLEELFRDKDTGQPLSNGTIEFYKDSARNVPKAAYQISGSSPNYSYVELPNPLTLSAVGNVQNASGHNEVIYWYPYDVSDNPELYYVVVKDQDGVEQFTREAWPNPQGSSAPVTTTSNEIVNQISNATFNNILINDGASWTITVAGAVDAVYPIAPSWDLVLSGTGTVIVQRTSVPGSDNVPTNPPYVLDLDVSAGITDCNLRQRFNANSGLWSSFGTTSVYLNAGMVVKSFGFVAAIEFIYAPSSGAPVSITSVNAGAIYEYVSGSSSAIPASGDPSLGENGYVDLLIKLPENNHVAFSNITLFPSTSVQTQIIPPLDSSNRNEVYQGDYYIPRLGAKTQRSYLVGWDFPMNPFQKFVTSAPTTITTTAQYIADQTIAKCQANTLDFSQSSSRGSLLVAWTAGTPNSFYLLQYLSDNVVRDILSNRLSVNIFGRVAAQSAIAYSTTMRVYLFRAGSTGSIPTLPTTIVTTLNADGTYTGLAANWTEVARSNLDVAKATVSGTGTTAQIFEKGFSGWQITDSSELSNTDKFAVLVTFTVSNGIAISLNSISLVPGDIPCRPAPLTYQETLLQCQYYFKKSFLPSVAPDVNVGVGSGEVLFAQSTASGVSKIGTAVSFPVRMRANPNVTLYNPTNAISTSSIRNITNNLNWSNTSAIQVTVNGFAVQGDAPGGSDFGELNGFHYKADARLGVV